MNNRLLQAILSCSVFSLAWASHSWRAEAAIVGRETPDKFTLNFNAQDLSSLFPVFTTPSTQSGPLIPIFSGQYWQVFGQTVPDLAPGTMLGYEGIGLLFQQVTPGQIVIPGATYPTGAFAVTPLGLFPPFPEGTFTEQISYLANSAGNFSSTVDCPLGSANCVFYESTVVFPPTNDSSILPPLSTITYQLQGFFQPPGTPKSVPEASTDVGAIAVLGLIAVLRIKRLFT